jgi:hypothetical protein
MKQSSSYAVVAWNFFGEKIVVYTFFKIALINRALK